jgi:hypothetical protein
MPDTTSEPLATALVAAARAGLRLAVADDHRRWTSLTCETCGGSLDVPADGGRRGLTAAAAARRVDAFTYRHQPGRAHL